MTAYEFWVDNVNGDNANSGTEGSPFATIRYATTTGLPNGLTSSDSVVINLVPGTAYTNADDYIRPESTECQGVAMTVRSSVPGTPVRITIDQLIYMIGTADLSLRLEDIHSTCGVLVLWAGLSSGSATGLRLTLAPSCVFTHDSTDAEDAMAFDSDATDSSCTIEPGCQINGWASLLASAGAGLTSVDWDGLIADAGQCNGDKAYIPANDINIRNCTLSWPRSQANTFQLRGRGTTPSVRFADNIVTINSTATDALIQMLPDVAGGSTTVDLVVDGNTIVANAPGPALIVGAAVVETNNRATNDATMEQFASGSVTRNIVTNDNLAGEALRVMVGADNVVVDRGNYFRVGTLGDTTNVHQIYLYGANVRFEGNYCQASVLAFGPGQIIRDNIIVADRPILLGGTQGGGQAVGGGNDYYITDNTLVAFENDCISDYAFNGAYGSGSNLGTLRAVVDRNTYVVLSGANGIALLTDGNSGAGWTATTLAELQNLWQNSALTAGSTTWGEATNKANDGKSAIVSSSGTLFGELAVASAALSSNSLVRLKQVGDNAKIDDVNTDSASPIVRRFATAIDARQA